MPLYVEEALSYAKIKCPATIGNHKVSCPRCGTGKYAKRTDLSVTIKSDSLTWNCHRSDCGFRTPTFKEDPEFYSVLYGSSFTNQNEYKKPVKTPPKKPKYKPTGMSEAGYRWLEGRGLSRSVIDRMGVTVAKRKFGEEEIQCLAFPVTVNGEVVNVKYRTPDKRFQQEKDALRVFLGLDTVGDHDTAVIVEGEIDQGSLIQAGLDQRMGILSVPDGAVGKVREEVPPQEEDTKFEFLWNSLETGLLDGVEKFILALDADEPGQAMTEELARRLGKERCYLVTWPSLNDAQLKDANEVLTDEEAGASVIKECIENAQAYPLQNIFQVNFFRETVHRIYQQGRQRGQSTGFVNLDEFISIVPGMFTVVTGTPGSGKSELVDAICMNLAMKHEWKVAVCSFENDPASDHLPKLAEKYLGMPFFDMPTVSRMGEGDLDKALDWLHDHYQFIKAGEESPTIEFILDRARQAAIRDGIKVLVIDPYNEIEQKRPRGMTETEYVSMLIGKCKRFAQAYGCHVFFVAHPGKIQRNRDGSVPIPTLMDISGSSHWWNKTDLGVVVHRPWDDALQGQSNVAEVYIRKVRFRWMGKPGLCYLEFNPVTGRYQPFYPPLEDS